MGTILIDMLGRLFDRVNDCHAYGWTQIFSRPVLISGSDSIREKCEGSLISSNLNIQDSTISSNSASVDGGGLYVLNGGLTLMNTTVCGNSPEQIAGTGWGDQGGNLILAQCQDCTGDINGDDVVNGADLSQLLGSWGTTSGPADIDGSGLVDGADLAALLGNWGNC